METGRRRQLNKRLEKGKNSVSTFQTKSSRSFEFRNRNSTTWTDPCPVCNYCRRHSHFEATRYKQQLEEARIEAQSQNAQKSQILSKEVATCVEQKEKPVKCTHDEGSEREEGKVLIKSFAS